MDASFRLLMQLIPGSATIVIICALIVMLLRNKASYFEDVRKYFIGACLGYVVLVLAVVCGHLNPSENITLYWVKISFSCLAFIATLVGLSAIILYKKVKLGGGESPKGISLKESYIAVYLEFTFVALFLIWGFTPFQTKQVGSLFGEFVYVPVFESWYFVSLYLILVYLFALPSFLFIFSSAMAEIREAAEAFIVFGLCWTGVGLLSFVFNTILWVVGFNALEIGYLTSTVLLGIMTNSFRKIPSIERVLEEKRLHPSIVRIKEGESAIVLYTPEMDKMKTFSAFVHEGILVGDRVVYVYPDEEKETVRVSLKKYGVDVERFEKKGVLLLMSISQAYLNSGIFDPEKSKEFWTQLEHETVKIGYKHERDLMDMGDLSIMGDSAEKYLEFMSWESDPFIIALRAFNAKTLKVYKERLIRSQGAKLINLSEFADAFSSLLGLTHEQIVGKRILLEFDPSSDYEKFVKGFLVETLANLEFAYVFTRKGSAVHSASAQEKGVKFFFFTQQVSVPVDTSSETLLPMSKCSLILDYFDNIQREHKERLCLVFDGLSDLLSVDKEETYSFVRYALELLSFEKTTAVFLLNSTAHDLRTVSVLRSMFNDQLSYGIRGLKVIKVSR